MVQLEQTEKKPRLQHSDLANSALTPKERQREWQKRWLANEKHDPHRAQEIKERNTANKRAWRKRKGEEMQRKQHTPDTNSQGHAPQKRPRTSSPEAPSGCVGPSISEPDTIPIDPILLAQETLTTIVTPRPMCDITVMTDTPSPPVNCSSIPDDQAYPSPTLSALTDLKFRDLANPIIGSQVHEQSDTVQWDDGSTTVLPCIMKNGINICEEDALAHSDWRFTSRQLCDEISAALRINKAVVIRQVSTPKPATLDLEYLQDRGMSDLMRVVVHDAEQRVKDFTYPHQNATLAEFICNIHDPNKIQCILNVPYGQGGLPSYLSTLDSGITNGWNQTTVDCPIGDKVHPDNFIVHSWSLLHGPAYWTNPHHNSDGSVTFVQIETGEKKWGLFKPIHEDTITRTNLSDIALTLTDLYRNRENIQENWHGEIVTLLLGDMLEWSSTYHAYRVALACNAISRVIQQAPHRPVHYGLGM
ncbi:hypothetical protein BDR03DRAFT_986919 [Suillus americanus]|nr:hypothetical protein BDR03DRAFT_986919 [Suillus americanus]